MWPGWSFICKQNQTENNQTWTSAAHLSLFQMMFDAPNKPEHLPQRANCAQHPQCCSLVCDSEQHYIKICCDAAVPSHLARQRSLPWKRLLGSNVLFCCFFFFAGKTEISFHVRDAGADISVKHFKAVSKKYKTKQFLCVFTEDLESGNDQATEPYSVWEVHLLTEIQDEVKEQTWDNAVCFKWHTPVYSTKIELRSLLAPNIAYHLPPLSTPSQDLIHRPHGADNMTVKSRPSSLAHVSSLHHCWVRLQLSLQKWKRKTCSCVTVSLLKTERLLIMTAIFKLRAIHVCGGYKWWEDVSVLANAG